MADQTTVILTKLEVDAKQATTELEKVTKAQKETTEATKETEKATTDYTGALDGLVGGLDVLPGKTGGAVKGIMNMTKGMNGLKVAIIATGIGALIVALGALFTWFNRTSEGQEKMKQGLAILGQITNVLMDAFAWLGETMFKAFENPKQAVSDLWNFIKNNFINRIKAVADIFANLGKTIASAFKMDFEGMKKSLADLGTALIQVTTGFDAEQQIAMVNKLKGAWDDAAESIRKANEIQKERNQLSRDEIAFLTESARLSVKISEARLKAMDTEKKNEERLAAAAEAIASTNALIDEQIRLKQTAVDLLKREQDLSNNTIEDNKALAEMEAELILLNKQRADALKEVLGLQNSIINAIRKEREDYAKTAADNTLKMKELSKGETDDLDANLKKQMAARQKSNDAAIASYTATSERIREQDEQTAEFRKEQQASAAESGIALLAMIGEKNKVAARIAVVLGTAQAIVASMKVGMPWALPGVALATLTGLKQLQVINTTKAERGGLLSGQPHSRGGVMINAEGGEAIINKRSMANPYLRKLASDINVAGGGVAFAANGMLVGQTQMTTSMNALSRDLQKAMGKQTAVLVLEDFHTVNNRVQMQDSIATLG